MKHKLLSSRSFFLMKNKKIFIFISIFLLGGFVILGLKSSSILRTQFNRNSPKSTQKVEIDTAAIKTESKSLPTPLFTPGKKLLGLIQPLATPKQTLTINQEKKSEINISPTKGAVNPTQTPIPTSEPTINVLQVNLEIKNGDSSSNFSIGISENMNVCDVLSKARDEGKISSVSFDDSYMETFKSKFVTEINGIKSNWVFKVNGTSPLGCSLYTVKNSDKIEWETL